MDARQQRGLELAAKSRIYKKDDGTWSVPSQVGKGRYVIEMGEQPHCSCPDYESREAKCKHIFAVEYVLERERHEDGSETVTETLTVTETVQRKTYPQNWTAYNAAQTTEKAEFQRLLFALCANVKAPEQTNGRPRVPLSEALFSAVFKVYSTVSGRRFMSDLTDAQGKGYIQKVPHFNTIFNYLEMPQLKSVLTGLIVESSLPLASVDTDFAVDSTGFGSNRFTTWYETKYGSVNQHDWVKTHICCGVKTNVVTAVEISERNSHDAPFFPQLVRATAENFDIQKVLADKGYTSSRNLQAVEEIGAVPYIAFRRNTKLVSDHRGGMNHIWNRMYHYYSLNREEFLANYHKRSNVESTFMAIKAKFGDAVRSKTPVAQANEVLCKVLCHNICCVIQSMHELGIEPEFGKVA
ncbi:MAG: transposase [Edaphobacter sp.]